MSSYHIRKNWLATIELMLTKPVVILPFFVIAFLEGLALELIYFSARKPLAFIAAPIIRKFFGEPFLHYPGNLNLLNNLFYYAQLVIYIFAGVFLAAISINVFRNLKSQLPVKLNAMVRNALNRYLSFMSFAVIVVVLIFLLKRLEMMIFLKIMQAVSKRLPQIILKLTPVILTVFLFLTNILMQTFLVLAIPLMVIEKKSLFKALAGSVYLGLRNFVTVFSLIFLPFFIYFPIMLLKNYSIRLGNKTFPEITIHITGLGIIMVVFLDCFIIMCASQFVMDRNKAMGHEL